MSLEAMTWAIELEGLTPTENHVLLLLANRHNKDSGLCYPSIPRLCNESGMHRATVIRAIKRLENRGVLTIEKTFGKANHYRLHTSITELPVAESYPSHKATTPVAESDYTRRTVRPEPKRTVKNPKNRKTPIPEDFGISDGVRLWAEKNGHRRLNAHLENFVDAAKAKDYRYVDWDAAFKTAIRKNWAGIK